MWMMVCVLAAMVVASWPDLGQQASRGFLRRLQGQGNQIVDEAGAPASFGAFPSDSRPRMTL